EPVHEDLDDVRLWVEVEVPHVLEDGGLRDGAAGVAHEVLEEGELARLEVERRAGPGRLAREEVEREGARREAGRLGGAGAAADERLEPGQQLGEGERLGEVVVAAALEAAHAVVQGALRAEDEERRRHPAPAEVLDEREAVAPRQHEVHHGSVVGLVQGEGEGLVAVGGVVHGVAGLAEALADELGDGAVVFDDEEAHGGARGEGPEPARPRRGFPPPRGAPTPPPPSGGRDDAAAASPPSARSRPGNTAPRGCGGSSPGGGPRRGRTPPAGPPPSRWGRRRRPPPPTRR